MFNLNSFLTRFKRGGSGVSAQLPARRASGSPYEGATAGRRLGNWVTTRDAINSVWYQSADQLVARSRDIVRKDGWASKAVDEWVCNAIGTGIKPQSMHPTLAVKEKLQALWSLWANEADAAGMTDIYGLQALAFRSMVEGGECFARRHDRDLREGLSVPLQFQLLEAEQLPFYLARPTPNTPQGNVVRASIEFDPSGRRTAYYFYKQHPGERAGDRAEAGWAEALQEGGVSTPLSTPEPRATSAVSVPQQPSPGEPPLGGRRPETVFGSSRNTSLKGTVLDVFTHDGMEKDADEAWERRIASHRRKPEAVGYFERNLISVLRVLSFLRPLRPFREV